MSVSVKYGILIMIEIGMSIIVMSLVPIVTKENPMR